jgi:hypothetical protein
MKRTVTLILLFTALLSGYSNPAEAQFWKKKKKEQRRKPVPKKPVVKEKPIAKPVKKKRELVYPPTEKKARYRVDVLAPLYLSELVKDEKVTFKGKLPAKVLPGMEFYEGIKLAADTLTSFGFDVAVYVHDVTDTTGSPQELINRGGLDSTDLIIGSVPSQYVPTLAAFAKKHAVNFISAFSPSDADIKDNPYFTLLQPTLQSHCEFIVTNIKNKYPGKKPLLLYRTTIAAEQNAFNYVLNANNEVKQLPVNTLPAATQMKPLLDSVGVNVLIVTVLDNTYAEGLLQMLAESFPEYKFDIYGMPSWTTIATLKKPGVYTNMAVFVTTPFNFDVTTVAGQSLTNIYKKEYGGLKPGEMVFRGYETLYWYTYLLNKYGTIFNENLGDNGIAPFTRFNIRQKWDKQDDFLYNENQNLYLYRYLDGSYIIQQ